MTQLIVSIEDVSILDDVKNAIRMLRGVSSVKVGKNEDVPNSLTVNAINAAMNGDTIKCGNFDSYLKFVADV